MKTSLTLIFIFGCILTYSQELFDPYQVHTLDIHFYNPDYDHILQNRWDVDDKTYELASITFNGVTYDSVGVRYKGNSNFYFARFFETYKFPLNIDIDFVHKDFEILGYNKIKLATSIFDPTYINECIGYATEGYYLPAPETGYIQVSIDGEDIGLYESVESVSKPFLRKHFGNDDGTFFKCDPQYHYLDDYETVPDLYWHSEDSTFWKYTDAYELKSDYGWTELMDLIYTLNFDIDNIEGILNVDRVLWHFASTAVMPDLDKYNGLGFTIHNYYLYRNTSSGQFEIIPWDKDLTFGAVYPNVLDAFEADISRIYEGDPFFHENNMERPFFSKLMSIPVYRKTYTAHMRTVIDDIYNVDYFQNLAYGIQDAIAEYVYNDSNQYYIYNGGQHFRYNVDNFIAINEPIYWGDTMYRCGITSTVALRRPYLLSHPEIIKTPPEILNVSQENTDPVVGEDVVILAEVTGATSVELMTTKEYYPSHFEPTLMYDDGQHGDGAANDNIYGAIVPHHQGRDHVKYYIRAFNEETLVLSPEKAERVFYEYIIEDEMTGSPVLINEINYNSSDFFDPGDWVELYNTQNESIDIGNWVFKDGNDAHQFIIPDNTMLDPFEYLVLCNDQESFNALFPEVDNVTGDLEFGLSGNGELLRLYNDEGYLADTVHFDDSLPWPAEADGNGSSLELIDPASDNAQAVNWRASDDHGTPGKSNNYTSIEITSNTKVKIYPNPATNVLYCQSDIQFQLEIYDNLGRKLLSSNKEENDISNIRKGIYHVRILNNESNILRTEKLIIE